MKRFLFSWALGTIGLFAALPLCAEPYMAFREGLSCSQCHVNMSGGGKRNDFGTIYAKANLPMWNFPSAEMTAKLKKQIASRSSKDPVEGFTGRIGKFISLGGNLRLANNTTFSSPVANNFGFNEGNLYVEANLIGDFLTFYLDQTMAPVVANREMFGLIKGIPGNIYLKGGRFLPPYGIRLLDNTTFTRLGTTTGFNYNSSDVGVEVGFEPGPFSIIGAFTEGDPANKSKQISTTAQFIQRRYRVGASFAYNNGTAANKYVYGFFAGGNYGRFTLLGEIDFVKDQLAAGTTNQIAWFAELDYLIAKGLNLKVNYQWLDPIRAISQNNRTRVVAGLEWFPARFLQTSLFYRLNDSVPQNPAENDDEIFYELHFFF